MYTLQLRACEHGKMAERQAFCRVCRDGREGKRIDTHGKRREERESPFSLGSTVDPRLNSPFLVKRGFIPNSVMLPVEFSPVCYRANSEPHLLITEAIC